MVVCPRLSFQAYRKWFQIRLIQNIIQKSFIHFVHIILDTNGVFNSRTEFDIRLGFFEGHITIILLRLRPYPGSIRGRDIYRRSFFFRAIGFLGVFFWMHEGSLSRIDHLSQMHLVFLVLVDTCVNRMHITLATTSSQIQVMDLGWFEIISRIESWQISLFVNDERLFHGYFTLPETCSRWGQRLTGRRRRENCHVSLALSSTDFGCCGRVGRKFFSTTNVLVSGCTTRNRWWQHQQDSRQGLPKGIRGRFTELKCKCMNATVGDTSNMQRAGLIRALDWPFAGFSVTVQGLESVVSGGGSGGGRPRPRHTCRIPNMQVRSFATRIEWLLRKGSKAKQRKKRHQSGPHAPSCSGDQIWSIFGAWKKWPHFSAPWDHLQDAWCSWPCRQRQRWAGNDKSFEGVAKIWSFNHYESSFEGSWLAVTAGRYIV